MQTTVYKMNNKVLLYSPGNYIQYPVINHNGKEYERHKYTRGLPRWLSGKESTCQCRRHRRCGFDPWVGKIPWGRKWQPTPVFLPGKFHGQKNLVVYSPRGRKESDITGQLSTHPLGTNKTTFLSEKIIGLLLFHVTKPNSN